ncbi:MAG: TetR/AcrR family transcriptional regulator [Pseudomonadota bacterium]
MPRPIKFDREAAIEKALQIIWRDGYKAASVNALSDALGITRSSFYNSFGSRETLFKLVLDRYLTQIPEAELFLLTKDDPLSESLTRIIRNACHFRAKDPDKRGCLAANSVAELLPSDNDDGKFVREVSFAMLNQIEQLIVWAKDRGELPATTDHKGLAMAVQGMVMGLNLQSKFLATEDELWLSASTSLEALKLHSSSN